MWTFSSRKYLVRPRAGGRFPSARPRVFLFSGKSRRERRSSLCYRHISGPDSGFLTIRLDFRPGPGRGPKIPTIWLDFGIPGRERRSSLCYRHVPGPDSGKIKLRPNVTLDSNDLIRNSGRPPPGPVRVGFLEQNGALACATDTFRARIADF